MRHIKPIGAFLIAFGLTISPLLGQPLVRLYGADGTNQTSVTNPFPVGYPSLPIGKGLSTNITVGSSVAVLTTFNGPCYQVTINNTSTTNTIYIQPFGGSATTSNFPLGPEQNITLFSTLPFTQISTIASGSGTVVGILSH